MALSVCFYLKWNFSDVILKSVIVCLLACLMCCHTSTTTDRDEMELYQVERRFTTKCYLSFRDVLYF